VNRNSLLELRDVKYWYGGFAIMTAVEDDKPQVQPSPTLGRGRKTCKALFACACIYLNPCVLMWIGVELN
jgi:hypothetical protein